MPAPRATHCRERNSFLRSRSLPETEPSYPSAWSNTHKGAWNAYSHFRRHFNRSRRCRFSDLHLVLTCCSSGRQGSDIFRTICSGAQARMRRGTEARAMTTSWGPRSGPPLSHAQEGAPVPDANAMNRCMYSVAFAGDHDPSCIDCFKALPTFLCSIFWNIST